MPKPSVRAPPAQSKPLGPRNVPRSQTSRQQHPVVVAQRAQRTAGLQLRIADGITAFAGSMRFVYMQAALFGIWMLFIEH